MPWNKITLPLDVDSVDREIEVCNRLDHRLSDRHADGEAYVCSTVSTHNPLELYCCPRTVELCSDILTEYGAVECDKPAARPPAFAPLVRAGPARDR